MAHAATIEGTDVGARPLGRAGRDGRGRDYGLSGPDGARAVALGLAAAQWYHTDVPRATMKALMQRSDGPAIRDTALWLGALLVSGALGVWLWLAVSPLAALPAFLVYGVLYGSAADSRWHECGHGTAFRTPWMNQAVYQLASFMMIRNPVIWRWSHARHHTDTVIVGRDPEIAVMRPAQIARVGLNVVGILDAAQGLAAMVRLAGGRLDADEASFVPEGEAARAVRVARVWSAVYAATLLAAFFGNSVLPLMLVGLPRLYGAWHHVLTGLLQHGGLADDVTDHRLNSRTVLMNPVSRFIYWNMNYHVEHHMFPMVPYHALPALHAAIRHDLPAPSPSILAAYREMWPAIRRQARDEDFFLTRALPPTARPYRGEFHTQGALPLAAE